MSANLGTRIIDGDGHIMEDNAGIIAHMEGAYREIAGRKGTCFPPLDHLHSGRAVGQGVGDGDIHRYRACDAKV